MREIEVKPSRLLGLLLFVMLLLALGAVYLAAIPDVVKLIVGVVAVGLSMWGWQRTCATEALRISADGGLQRQDETGGWSEVDVLGDSLVSPLIMVLRYRDHHGRLRSWVLLPDSASGEDLRRLRVSLRWARHTHSDTSSPGAG